MADEKISFLNEAQAARTGLVAEFIDFLKHNKKWWMAPVLLAMVTVGVLVLLAANPAITPFLYAIF